LHPSIDSSCLWHFPAESQSLFFLFIAFLVDLFSGGSEYNTCCGCDTNTTHTQTYTSQRDVILSVLSTLYCLSLCLLTEYYISLFLFSETIVYCESTHDVCAGDPVCIYLITTLSALDLSGLRVWIVLAMR